MNVKEPSGPTSGARLSLHGCHPLGVYTCAPAPTISDEQQPVSARLHRGQMRMARTHCGSRAVRMAESHGGCTRAVRGKAPTQAPHAHQPHPLPVPRRGHGRGPPSRAAVSFSSWSLRLSLLAVVPSVAGCRLLLACPPPALSPLPLAPGCLLPSVLFPACCRAG